VEALEVGATLEGNLEFGQHSLDFLGLVAEREANRGRIAFEADGNLECLVNLCTARLCDDHVDKTGSVMQRLPVAGVGAVLFQTVPGFFEKPSIVYAHGFVSLPKGE